MPYEPCVCMRRTKTGVKRLTCLDGSGVLLVRYLSAFVKTAAILLSTISNFIRINTNFLILFASLYIDLNLKMMMTMTSKRLAHLKSLVEQNVDLPRKFLKRRCRIAEWDVWCMWQTIQETECDTDYTGREFLLLMKSSLIVIALILGQLWTRLNVIEETDFWGYEWFETIPVRFLALVHFKR